MVNRADFVTIRLMIPGKALGTCYISFERELRTELISTVCSPTEQNQSFLMKRIYGCKTILLWWGLGVNATANVGRKRFIVAWSFGSKLRVASQEGPTMNDLLSFIFLSVAVSGCCFVIAKSQSKSDQQRFLERMWVCFLSLELFSLSLSCLWVISLIWCFNRKLYSELLIE